MGLSSSKSKTRSTSVSTPQVPSFISGPYTNFSNMLSGAMADGGTSNTRIGPTALQTQAFGGAAGLGGFNQALQDALGASRGLMGYTPNNVSAGQLADTNLDPYMNPYEDTVVQGTLADIERMRQGAISGNQSAATQAGAYGGSRHGIVDSETNRGAFDVAGRTAGQLRQSGYQNAQTAALADIANRLGADQFNVQSGLEGAGLRLNAANQTGSLGLAGDASRRADIGLQAELGNQQRDIDVQNDPNEARMRALAQIAALLGAFQGYPIGQTVNTTGTTTQSGSPIGAIGSAISGLGALFPSDRRLKRNIEALGADAKGQNWYAFDYVWGGPRRIGVMADEAPAHAVHVMDNGYLAVDYGALD